MKWLLTSLGAWDTIEGEERHKLTYPLAIVARVLSAVGHSVESWEGSAESRGTADGFDVIGIGAMDPRHFWRVAPWLRSVGLPDLGKDRPDRCPIVVIGGQAATAPAPVLPFVDVVFVGEAEAGLQALAAELDLWRAGRSRRATLEAVAALPGCIVPSCLPVGHVVDQVFAADLRISTDHLLSVSLSSNPRIEIARGCRGPAGAMLPPERWKACGFCVLGWRRPYQEAPAADVIAAVERVRAQGGRQLHLSAGDAEGHTQIRAIREAVSRLGIHDHGWTGRLDTIADCHVQPGKLYAFGIEGLSHRIRRAVGKPRLTDEVIAKGLGDYWRQGGRRVLLHVIGGFPTEGQADVDAFAELLERLGQEAAGLGETIHAKVGRQPFNPMPHTPMQWMPAGLHTAHIGAALSRGRWGALQVTETPGQQPPEAAINALAIRGGAEIWPPMRQGAPKLPREWPIARMRLAKLCRDMGRSLESYTGPIEVGAPLPWDMVRSAFAASTLEAEHARIMHILGAPGYPHISPRSKAPPSLCSTGG